MGEAVDWRREGLAAWLRMTLGAATVIAEEALEEWPPEGGAEWFRTFPAFGISDFVEENDPRAELDRIEAERRVIELHEGPHACVGHLEMRGPCPTLRALGYARRRSYGWCEEWAPDDVRSPG